jgi:hypothetical protein
MLDVLNLTEIYKIKFYTVYGILNLRKFTKEIHIRSVKHNKNRYRGGENKLA